MIPRWMLLVVPAISAYKLPSEATVIPRQVINDTSPACIPQNDQDPKARAVGVAVRDTGFIYGPSLIGNAAFFPNGTLGNARTAYDMSQWTLDRTIIDNDVTTDATAVQAAIVANKGLNSLDDYTNVLYHDQWKLSNPLGTAPGIMTNYTDDLLFSMERLSQNPFPLQLVKPTDSLPFALPDDVTSNITGASSLEKLQANESLFVVDHSYQAKYEKTTVRPQRYGAACTAYFYIHPKSGDFLPLAIKTNAGSDLIYTPLDSATDWLLAKMMFNVNDFFHAQMFHLVVTHDVSEAVHQAALHTLSEKHPVMVILERLMTQAYSSRVVGEQLCFNPGGHWDQLFYVDNVGCRQFVTETWPTRGAYQDGYLESDLQARGLIDKSNGFKFKSFPFFQDALRIRNIYRAFFTSFVNSYYANEAILAADVEVQAWFVEASSKAKVFGFPQVNLPGQPCDRATLIEVLTHFGYIVSVVHHALNGGDPVGSKATLPFHLNALYAPIPSAKGVKDLLHFLPPPADAVHYIGFLATFNRPFYVAQNRTLEHALENDIMMSRLNKETSTAAGLFLSDMKAMSAEIKGRNFDEQGLSMAMPFVYRTLDPDYIPFFCAV